MLLMQVASAAITITPVEVGCTYIKWGWAGGLTLTEMYFDGNVMCGYDTEANNITFTDLNPGELHTLQLLTAGDSGTNATYTNSSINCSAPVGNATGGFSSAAQDDSMFWTFAFVGMCSLIGIVVVKVR